MAYSNGSGGLLAASTAQRSLNALQIWRAPARGYMMIGPYQVAGAFQRVVAAGKCHLMIQHQGHFAWRALRQARRQHQNQYRNNVVEGTSMSVPVYLGVRRLFNKPKLNNTGNHLENYMVKDKKRI